MSLSNRSITDSSIRLRDGRTLGMAAVGKADGLPIFHCHSNRSSRLEVLTVASSAEHLGMRLMNMTFDGFFNLDWMGQKPSTPDQELNDDTIAELSKSGGAALVGYPFYSAMIPYWLNVENNPSASESERAVAHAVNNSHKIVISSTQETLEGEHSELLVVEDDTDLIEAVTKLKQQPGRDLAVIGGVRTAQTFVRLGLIDEYNLLVHPVSIGNGQRVFTGRVDLKLVSVKTYPSGVMRVCYRPA